MEGNKSGTFSQKLKSMNIWKVINLEYIDVYRLTLFFRKCIKNMGKTQVQFLRSSTLGS